MNPNREIFIKTTTQPSHDLHTHYFDKTLNIPSSHINKYKKNKYIFSALYISPLNSRLTFFYLLT